MTISHRLVTTISDFFDFDEDDDYPRAANVLGAGRGNPWFQYEFAQAIQAASLTPEIWAKATQTRMITPQEHDDWLRYIWSILFPNASYPTTPKLLHVPLDITSSGKLTGELEALKSHSLSGSLPLETLVSYLTTAPVVLAARTLRPDRIDSSQEPIPVAYRSDGVWVWSHELSVYVSRYAVSLPRQFLVRVRNAKGIPHHPTELECVAARAVLQAP